MTEEAQFKLDLEKNLSDDGEFIVAEVKLSEKLRELIKGFCVLNEPEVDESMDGMCSVGSVRRYKIKSVIKNSYNWYKLHAFFFTKAAVNEGVVSVKFSDSRKFRDFLDSLRYFREVIKNMEELKRSEKITIIYRVEK
jgi:hypothetical protein